MERRHSLAVGKTVVTLPRHISHRKFVHAGGSLQAWVAAPPCACKTVVALHSCWWASMSRCASTCQDEEPLRYCGVDTSACWPREEQATSALEIQGKSWHLNAVSATYKGSSGAECRHNNIRSPQRECANCNAQPLHELLSEPADCLMKASITSLAFYILELNEARQLRAWRLGSSKLARSHIVGACRDQAAGAVHFGLLRLSEMLSSRLEFPELIRGDQSL